MELEVLRSENEKLKAELDSSQNQIFLLTNQLKNAEQENQKIVV